MLLLMYCFLEGLSMIFFTKPYQTMLIDGYGRFSYQIMTNYDFHLIVPPSIIVLNSYYIILLTGFSLVLGSIMLILGSKIFKYVISVILLLTLFIIHNPFLYYKRQEIEFHIEMSLLSIGLISGTILI